jgi:hypothetical protein
MLSYSIKPCDTEREPNDGESHLSRCSNMEAEGMNEHEFTPTAVKCGWMEPAS